MCNIDRISYNTFYLLMDLHAENHGYAFSNLPIVDKIAPFYYICSKLLQGVSNGNASPNR